MEWVNRLLSLLLAVIIAFSLVACDSDADYDYEEGIVIDCGQDDYDPFLLVKLGVTPAPHGKFSPNQNLTEEEALLIMIRICALADPALIDDTTVAAEAVSICLDNDVIELNGYNVYTAAKKITGQLALVRCNHLYSAIFE